MLNLVAISETYHKSTSDMTWAITVTLMFRPIGAIIFGIMSDRMGRKWPLIINIILYSLIEIGTGFCTTYTQFIIVRGLFGIAMGGIYGNCATTALEDLPIETRGVLSGLLQQVPSVGYLLAAAFNAAITDHQRYGWRAMFWFGGGPPLLIALWRVFLPETEAFLNMKKAYHTDDKTDQSHKKLSAIRSFMHSIRSAFLHHWLMITYLVLMMAGFNFLSHGSQDIYPTFLEFTLHFSHNLVNITMIIANCGAIIGGILVGCFSNFIGRRLSMIIVLIIGAALIPAYVLPRNNAIIAGAFFQQMCVQGASGVLPIHLMELSPVHYRSFVVGIAQQFGNLIAAPTATIQTKTGQHFPLTTNTTQPMDTIEYDYTTVIAIFLACVYIYLFIIILLGPEKRNIDEAICIKNNNNINDDYDDTRSDIQLEESSSKHHSKIIEKV